MMNSIKETAYSASQDKVVSVKKLNAYDRGYLYAVGGHFSPENDPEWQKGYWAGISDNGQE